jgi:hypothetical protein
VKLKTGQCGGQHVALAFIKNIVTLCPAHRSFVTFFAMKEKIIKKKN